ncbi:MAG: transcriptional repressor [Clostridia bacterium]|nr:transcriptional repressor [Clostridia bacterium]MDY5264926.1 transcriptional repressor [Eubacteriales bacterium]MDY5440289.1 transcriptional repressor [Eubacteriales bacterium]
MNYTKVKDNIYEVVYENPTHMTAEEVYVKMLKTNSTIGIATVYRNLAKLVEEGKVQKLTGLGDSDRYDADVKKHFHFYCTKCKKVYDLYYPEQENIDITVEKITGHKILNHDFVFSGICKDCLGGKND